jgi:hypothetical protein
VEECLDSVAKSVKVWNRDAIDDLEIKEGVTWGFATGIAPPRARRLAPVGAVLSNGP